MKTNYSLYINRKKIISFICCAVFLSNIIQFGIIRDYPIFQVALLALFPFVFSVSFFNKHKVFALLISLLFFVSVFSFLVNNIFYNLFSYLFFGFSVLIIYTSGANFNESDLKKFFSYFIFFTFLIFTVSLMNFTTYRFQGVFDNPNGMGRFAAWSALLTFSVVIFSYDNHIRKNHKYFYSLVFIFSISSLLASNSRLSLFSFLGAVVAVFFLILFRRIALMSVKRKSITKIVFYAVIIFLASVLLYKLGLFDSLVYKFVATAERGDFTQGRLLRWELAIPYLSWFGKGHEIYETAGLYEVHNNYISQVLIFGWLPAISVYLLLFYMYFKAIYRCVTTGYFGYFLSVAFFTFYFIYSLFETGFAILPIYMAIFFLGFSDRNRITPSLGVNYVP